MQNLVENPQRIMSNVLISALSIHALQLTFSIIPLVRSFSSLENSLLISISPLVWIHILGGLEFRQGDTGITNHYPVSKGDEDNNWPRLLVNYLAMSFILVKDARIQYCQTVRDSVVAECRIEYADAHTIFSSLNSFVSCRLMSFVVADLLNPLCHNKKFELSFSLSVSNTSYVSIAFACFGVSLNDA
ncbi:MAG: hypothetical protein EZS28_009908 [Streblomastix strix]|uniref:Uncharacterized protein n=1 Tax=Streblomastix strix TaxID=222440 RepID=A0A5J4WHT2_9EUKA|nr:MAG: hypothetical protein EZS28_009908 [Streblomastix strix]